MVALVFDSAAAVFSALGSTDALVLSALSSDGVAEDVKLEPPLLSVT